MFYSHEILECYSWKCYRLVYFITIRSNHDLWPLGHWGHGPLPPLKYALANDLEQSASETDRQSCKENSKVAENSCVL